MRGESGFLFFSFPQFLEDLVPVCAGGRRNLSAFDPKQPAASFM